MTAIRFSNTKLENKVTKELWKRELRFRKNIKKLPNKPNIAICKVAIFNDSCFWHGCRPHSNKPKANEDYWNTKLDLNRKKDDKITKYYKEKNWHILRIWEHEVKADFENAVNIILRFAEKAKK